MRERQPLSPTTPLSHAGFTAVVDRHQHALHTFLRGMARHDEQARDLLQDTFHDAWRAARDGTPPFAVGVADEEMRRWLFAVAYRKVISLRRRQRLLRWDSLEDAPEEALRIVEPESSSFENRLAEGEALSAALAQLTPTDAACLLLRIIQGFSAAEVGQIVGATPEVITKRLSRAKQRLRAVYLALETPRKEQNVL
jgi:RNA polymerase sigma-70 factor (ECF subfamily)